MNVLIIDDSQDLCKAVKGCLECQNYLVDTAYDGKSGLRKALTNEYDIILLDIMLPQMNGYEVLKKLRGERRFVPTIMITAKNNVSDMIEGLELGADDFLQKPFNIDVLAAKIRAIARRNNIDGAESDYFRYADFTLTVSTKKLATIKLEITLKDAECEVMKYFIKNSSVIVPEEKITKIIDETLPGEDSCGCINQLIKKLRYICSRAKIIAIKGVGYKLCY